MKSYKRLYPDIYAFPQLLKAAEKARKGKRQKDYVARFHFQLEEELLRLESELRNYTYTPGPYKEFFIVEPKVRLISAAPYRDRVVHHALIQTIEPLFERTFIPDTYACRVGKGTHRAVDRFTQFCRRNTYVLKCDIRKYLIVSLNCRDEFPQTVGRVAPAPVICQGSEAELERTTVRSSSRRDPSVWPPWLE